MVKYYKDYDLEKEPLEEIVVKINRCAKVVKGGRRFSFAAFVVVGNRKGVIGIGHGKANEVPFAVSKAVKDAQKKLVKIPLAKTTIPHTIQGKFGATKVLLMPACEGTGIIAGASTKASLELAGITNILTKVYGSSNPANVIRATLNGLLSLRTLKDVQNQRGVKVV